MTLKKAREKLRALGLTLRKNDGEYRVNYMHGEEATAYYTKDLKDAVDTGIAMSRTLRKGDTGEG